MRRLYSPILIAVLLGLMVGSLRAQPWQTNSADDVYYTGGQVGIGMKWPKAHLDVEGYRTHVVTNTSSTSDPLFTSLGTVDSRRSVWIRATDNGCGLGGSVIYHIAGGWMGGTTPSQRIKVYSLGDNDAYPAVETHFSVYLSKVDSKTYRLGLLHEGGCDGSSKRVRFVVTANHFNSQNTDGNIDNYVKMPVRRYLYQDEDGRVGIGEPDPSKKLEVNGHVRAKEVIVETDGWSDYVFDESYDLPTLEEVSAFIEKQGHLPSVPSAEEVEKTGLHLGEMDATLLRKVEELTLYAIEQKKRADRHTARSDSLAKQLERVRERLDAERKARRRQQRQIDALQRQVRTLLDQRRDTTQTL